MNNQKGLTLIEVLAALTVASVVLGVASMLLFSMNDNWGRSISNRELNVNIDQTMLSLTQNMTDTVKAYYTINGAIQDLRIKTGSGLNTYNYRSIQYDSTSRTVTIYNISNPTETDNQITGGTLENARTLSDNVTAFTVSSEGSSNTNFIKKNGELIEFNITFEYTKSTNTTATFTKTIPISYKLLKES